MTELQPPSPLASLAAAVAVTLCAQALVVLASLVLPLTAALALAAIGLPAHGGG